MRKVRNVRRLRASQIRTSFATIRLQKRKDIIIDVIAILSARKAKSRAQLTAMRTTVAYTRTKHCFMLDS